LARKYPIKGIDVSKHTAKVNWQHLIKEGYTFVYIKATEGSSYQDPRYEQHTEAARKAGLQTGAYHFFRFKADGVVQAKLFLKQYLAYPHELPPVIDFETEGNRYYKGSSALAITRLKDCINHIARAIGRRPIVYADYGTYKHYIGDTDLKVDYWIASTGFEPEVDRMIMWQYAINQTHQHANGLLDFNAVVVSDDKWRRLCR
jgi:lysozyme